MMSFHRLFWIPEGMEPKDGAYVTYPAEELYARPLAGIAPPSRPRSSARTWARCPTGCGASMRRHAVARTWILLGSLRPRGEDWSRRCRRAPWSCSETHDMVPLAGFLHGDDIETRVETGQLDSGGGAPRGGGAPPPGGPSGRPLRRAGGRVETRPGSARRSSPDASPISRAAQRRWSW